MRLKQKNLEQKVIGETKNSEQLKFDCGSLKEEKSQLECSMKEKNSREECLKKEIHETTRMLKKTQDENSTLQRKISIENSRNISSEQASQELLQRKEDAVLDCKRLKKEIYKLTDKLIALEEHLQHLMERSTTKLKSSQKQLKLKRQEVRKLKTIISDLSNDLVAKESIVASRKKEISFIISEAADDKKRMIEEKNIEITKSRALYDVNLLKWMNEVKTLKDERDECITEKESYQRESKALVARLKKESKKENTFLPLTTIQSFITFCV